jgi:anthranilate synthase component 1
MLVDLARNDLSIHGKIQRFPNWRKFIFFSRDSYGFEVVTDVKEDQNPYEMIATTFHKELWVALQNTKQCN